MARHTYVVFTNPAEGQEDEYNEWYENVHVPDILNLEGFVSAQRFKLTTSDPAQEFSHTYLALYEVETDDIEKIKLAMAEAGQSGAMRLSPALDRVTINKFFTPLGDKVTAG